MPTQRPCHLLTRIRRAQGEDAGFALIVTVLMLAVLSSFSLVMLKQVIDGAQASRKDQDWVASLSAAQAGLDEYASRLNQSDGGYYIYNPANPALDPTNPDPANPAMGSVAGKTKWAPVPQVSGSGRASFHYDIDTTTYTGTASVTANGSIKVTSTGRVGVRTRTLEASIRRSGFLDYVYFTDFETQDPLDYAPSSQAAAKTSCGLKYAPQRANGCTVISFANDTLDGPVHSNDIMNICNNVTFRKTVTTYAGGNSAPSFQSLGCTTTGTVFGRSGDPAIVAKVTMPATNASLKAQTLATASPRGCLYVGPTKIVIRGSQMLVTSPWTKSVTPGCTEGSYMSLPTNGVVFVDDVPADGTADINSWGKSKGGGKPVCPASGNNVGYPIAGEANWDDASGSSRYGCRVGDVFVEELGGNSSNALDGRLTISANNNLYVTNHIDYLNGTSGSSFLGLIAKQFLYYWHPTDSSGNNLNLPGTTAAWMDARVSASLLSVDHAVTVMNYNLGAQLGTLNLTGNLTQRYRGIVRQGGGYSKNYVYDPRLRYDAPPHFLDPTSSSFRNNLTIEVPRAYNAS